MYQRKASVMGPQTMHGQSRFVSEHEAREARAVIRKMLGGTTQRKVAEKIGVSKTSLCLWINNGYSPSRDAYSKIMKYAGAV
jgi:DNA-binding XRE family transcriptional regulator